MSLTSQISWQVIPAADYPAMVVRDIAASRSRVMLAALVGLNDEKTAPIFNVLYEALDRGIAADIVFDTFSTLPIATGPLRFGPVYWRTRQATLQAYYMLEAKGAQVSLVSKLGPNPFKRRFHAKAAIIDDICYSFGGINLVDVAFTTTDYMLRTQTTGVAEAVTGLMQQFAAGEVKHDIEQPLSREDIMLFDAGVPGKSLIYEKACQLAQGADEIWYVSQMCPGVDLARSLRTSKTHAYFLRPDIPGFPINLSQWVDTRRAGLPNLYKRSTYIHAKCILYKMKNGELITLSGSHNFSWRGVAYGTQEIALLSHSQELWRGLYAYIQREVT